MWHLCYFVLEGDRRLNKSGGGYNSESSGGYSRGGYGAAEPEWFTEGPISQSDTIELRGFDSAHSDRPRMHDTSGSDASHDGSRIDGEKAKSGRRDRVDGGASHDGSRLDGEKKKSGRRDRVDGGGKSAKSQDNSSGETTSNAVPIDEHHEESDSGQCCMLLCKFFV